MEVVMKILGMSNHTCLHMIVHMLLGLNTRLDLCTDQQEDLFQTLKRMDSHVGLRVKLLVQHVLSLRAHHNVNRFVRNHADLFAHHLNQLAVRSLSAKSLHLAVIPTKISFAV
jgi:hypothetical protein